MRVLNIILYLFKILNIARKTYYHMIRNMIRIRNVLTFFRTLFKLH